MKFNFALVSLFYALSTFLPVAAKAGDYRAFSLAEARRQLQADPRGTADVRALGGITRPIAVVFDEASGDLIIVGEHDPRGATIKLDDLIVAMRAVLRYNEAPLVSIDPPARGAKPSEQPVRFAGKVENTQFGQDLLAADVVLKKIGLGKIKADVWGVRSYFDLAADDWKQTGAEDHVQSRFWFLVDQETSAVAVRRGVGLLKRLKIKVETEVSLRADNTQPGQPRDSNGDAFARTLTGSLDDLSLAQPEFHRLDQLYRLVGVVSAIEKWQSKFGMKLAGLDYWLAEYPVAQVVTPPTYDLVSSTAHRETGDGTATMTVSGGIELRAVVADVKNGSIIAVQDLVLKSRPQKTALIWKVPFGDSLDGLIDSVAVSSVSQPPANAADAGMNLDKSFTHPGALPPKGVAPPTSVLPPTHALLPTSVLPPTHSPPVAPVAPPAHVSPVAPVVPLAGSFPPAHALQATGALPSPVVAPLGHGSPTLHPPQSFESNFPAFQRPMSIPASNLNPAMPHVGGVMLFGSAQVNGNAGAVDLSGGGFSFIVDGQDAQLSPEAFDRFVTALWAVYYCKQAPGISIDPIHPEINKHLVRYIGNVLNSDLGRVMREADYHMKKCVVGAERPAISGFKTPDDWMADNNQLYLAYRRFWFVPEDLRFRQGNGMLLFDSGRMRLKTELMSNGERGQTTPADDNFANFYTEHYDDFIKLYPIYGELFEYAKMVTLANYLKTQGVPLHWFLLANRDRILTEDSPGTVVEFARKSSHFEGVELKGGVDLGAQGRYVSDPAAMEAISAALGKIQHSSDPADAAPAAQPRPTVISPADGRVPAYTAVPQKSLTSGHDSRGLRYQTDVAFRMDGEPALELVRYFDWRKGNHGMFGNGWDILLPYRVSISPEIKKFTVEGQEIFGPATVFVEDRLNRNAEKLDFDPAKFSNLGYIPPANSRSKTIGLFVTAGGARGAADEAGVPAYRLADKLGNEFSFNQQGFMTEMVLGQEHRLTYVHGHGTMRAIAKPCTKLLPVPGGGEIEIAGYSLPRRRVLTDADGRTGLVLVAQPDGRYFPEGADGNHVMGGMALVGGRFTMVDMDGNEMEFGPDGSAQSIKLSNNTDLVQSMRYERLEEVPGHPDLRNPKVGQDIEFEFLIDLTGSLRVGRAKVTCHAPRSEAALRYEYDDSGCLTRVVREESH